MHLACRMPRSTTTNLTPHHQPSTRIGAWCLLLVLLCFVSPWAQAQKRVALVIGNSAYRNEAPLRNPVNDAALIEQTLKGDPLKFDTVAVVRNASRGELLHALARFRQQALGADVAIVYYSGHGMINSRRQNHLLPVEMPRLAADAGQDIDTTLKAYGVSEDEVIDAVEGARIQVVVLDACRDNGFDPTRKSTAKGLARRIDLARNRLLAYATEEGRTAEDGAGNNSTYAMSLARHLRRTDWSLLQVFDEVASEVERTTRQAQSPTRSGNLRTDVYLMGPPRIAEPDRPSASQIEDQMWKEALAVNNVSAYEAYLKFYPDGAYAKLARFKLAVSQGPNRVVREPAEQPAPRPQPTQEFPSSPGRVSRPSPAPSPDTPGASAVGSQPADAPRQPSPTPLTGTAPDLAQHRWRYAKINPINSAEVESAEIYVTKLEADKLFLSSGDVVSSAGVVHRFAFNGRQIEVLTGIPLFSSTPGFSATGSRTVLVNGINGDRAEGQLSWTVAGPVSSSDSSHKVAFILYFSERSPVNSFSQRRVTWSAVYPSGAMLPSLLEANESASYYADQYVIKYQPMTSVSRPERVSSRQLKPQDNSNASSNTSAQPASRTAADCQSVTVSASTRHRCLEQRD